MIEAIALIALLFLIWIIWQWLNARQFNQFRRQLIDEIKPQLTEAIAQHLFNSKNEQQPNGPAHVEATQLFWTCQPVRIVQGAIKFGLFDHNWLSTPQNKRNLQHLMHIQANYSLPATMWLQPKD